MVVLRLFLCATETLTHSRKHHSFASSAFKEKRNKAVLVVSLRAFQSVFVWVDVFVVHSFFCVRLFFFPLSGLLLDTFIDAIHLLLPPLPALCTYPYFVLLDVNSHHGRLS